MHRYACLIQWSFQLKTVFSSAAICLALSAPNAHAWQAWKDCVPNSIGPGGCDSIGPGGGKSIGPGGGLSIGPGGGMSIGPGGGQSIGPRGGQSIGPGGGKDLNRDRTRGLNPDTLQPYLPEEGGAGTLMPGFNPPPSPVEEVNQVPKQWPHSQIEEDSEQDSGWPHNDTDSDFVEGAVQPQEPEINYSQFDQRIQALQVSTDPNLVRTTYTLLRQDAEAIVGIRTQYLQDLAQFQHPDDNAAATRAAVQMIADDPEINDVRGRVDQLTSTVRRKLAGQ